MEHPTLYASELITINEKGYTKHYFEEGKRICSKIGGGFNNMTEDDLKKQVETLIEGYEEQIIKERDGVMHTFDGCMKVEPEIESYESNDLFRVIADNYIGKKENEPAFYYHSDHLGSASYVTNSDGKVTQTLNYLPYGEDWVDLQYFSEMPAESNLGVYKFNGKEKDAESGYNYYGARYYDSEKLSWISVDPMSDKYPSLSPYVYCANNPIRFIDPDGREIDPKSDNESVNQFNHVYSNIKDKIDYYNFKINEKMGKWAKNGYKIDCKYTKQIAKLNESRSELIDLKNSFDEIINSDVNFYLTVEENSNGDKSAGGYTIFNTDENRVDISFISEALGSIVHEVRHGYGFLLGEWDWNMNKKEPNNYDYQDEYEAYKNENIYNFMFGNQKEIKKDWYMKKYIIDGYSYKTYINKKFEQICVPQK